VIVADASIVVRALADDGAPGDLARAVLHGQTIRAPHVLDVEVVHALRANVRRGHLDPRRATAAIDDLARSAIVRVPHRRLLPRLWELRDNVSAYDAAYVALAEALGVPLVTADARLANAPGLRCDVEVLATPA
jgi:predicted nucleic acid-binding protein